MKTAFDLDGTITMPWWDEIAPLIRPGLSNVQKGNVCRYLETKIKLHLLPQVDNLIIVSSRPEWTREATENWLRCNLPGQEFELHMPDRVLMGLERGGWKSIKLSQLSLDTYYEDELQLRKQINACFDKFLQMARPPEDAVLMGDAIRVG